MIGSSLFVLENSHSISIMMYLSGHDGCKKSELYRDVCRGSLMPRKLDALEEAGFIEQRSEGRYTRLFITENGMEVGRALRDLDLLLRRKEY